MWYGYAADFMAFLHLALVGFVVVGQLLIMAAAPFKWQWARNPWFRFIHLAVIAFVVYESFVGMTCPLTAWEWQLRELAGQAYNASDTFLGRLVRSVLFIDGQPEIWYTTLYIAMLVVVVQGIVMYPPRMFRFKRSRPEAGAAANPATPAPVAAKPEPAIVA